MTIVTLAQSVCLQLDSIDALTHQKQNAENISATHKELLLTLRTFEQVKQHFYLLRTRLDLEELTTDFQKISATASYLQQQFLERTQLRQVQDLHSLQTQLSKSLSRIETKWKKYAEGQAKGLFDILEIVLQLPEMQSKAPAIRGLETRLKRYLSLTPDTDESLADFDHCFLELRKYTVQVENLHADVRVFLQKVHERRATMADVTDEVIRWCRQGEHAHSFKIQL